MLQCNRYPGLDANEIIRLTSAIGQKRKFSLSAEQPSEWPLRPVTSKTAYANNSAEDGLDHLDQISLQSRAYLSFSQTKRR